MFPSVAATHSSITLMIKYPIDMEIHLTVYAEAHHLIFFCAQLLSGFMATLQCSLQHKYIDIDNALREHIIKKA